MASDFPGSPIPSSNSSNNINFENRRVSNIEQDFDILPKYGERNSVVFPNAFSPGYYDELIGNHLQGVQRLKGGKYFVYSGGVSSKKIGNLIFIKYTCPFFHPTQRKSLLEGPVTSNFRDGTQPLVKNPHCEIYKLTDNNYWHVGGLSAMGDVLIVPVEDENKVNNRKSQKSKVLFVNVEDPANPLVYDKTISRPNQKAGAATAIKVANDKILCVVWSDSDDFHNDPTKKHRMDFYLSQSAHVNSEYDHLGTVFYKNIVNRPRHGPSYTYPAFQSLQFVQQENDGIYMIGLFNTSSIGIGTNKAFLLKVNYTDGVVPAIEFVKDHDFDKDDTFFNMMAAGGTYINSYNELTIYGAPYRIWDRREINFAEFCVPMHENIPAITTLEQSRIELYSDPDFRGPSLKIIGSKFTKIQNFNNYQYKGRTLDNAVTSAKYIIPPGIDYNLYPKVDWIAKPASKVKTLTGNGTVRIERHFDPSFDSVASSSKYD